MIKKILSVAGIVAVLLLTFLIPCSALELRYDTDLQTHYTKFLPYMVTLGSNNDGVWLENVFALPRQTDAPFDIENAREYGYVVTPSVGTSYQTLTVAPYLRNIDARYMQITLPSVVYIPTYNADGVHESNLALRCCMEGYSTGNYFGSGTSWKLDASYVVTYDDGSRYPAEGQRAITASSNYSGYSDIKPDLTYIVNTAFDEATTYNRIITSVAIYDYNVTLHNVTSQTDVTFIGYYDMEDVHIPYTLQDGSHMGDVNVIFDGDVGTADLVIKPLSALLNLPIFGNFTLGSVFAVIGTVGLFVVILKVFAGG